MGEKLPDRDARFVGDVPLGGSRHVGNCLTGDQGDDGVVDMQLSLLVEEHDRRRGKGLRVTRDPETGVLVDTGGHAGGGIVIAGRGFEVDRYTTDGEAVSVLIAGPGVIDRLLEHFRQGGSASPTATCYDHENQYR